jgi:hypothetical protein
MHRIIWEDGTWLSSSGKGTVLLKRGRFISYPTAITKGMKYLLRKIQER